MSTANYNLTRLVPDFGLILDGDFTSPEGLSACIVGFLIAVAAGFFVYSLLKFIAGKQHVKFYVRLLSGLTVEQLPEKRRELANKAFENKGYGQLWREFDESLVHVSDKQRLCNTLDAGHFFNTSNLARGLTENRLLAAVPGFLTAIGVIGTFAGLQMGLAELNVSSEDFAVLKTGIAGLIGGASIAFMTSVWGVLMSLVFNLVEKLFERNLRSSINNLQNQVDYLYPRITAEQSLANIEDYSRQSNDRLAELDEKIGNKMQEAMREASGFISEGMANSLERILGPAIDRLVTNAQSGSEKAMETMLDRFLEGVGTAGTTQRDAMEQAAREISTASEGMTNGLTTFVEDLRGHMDALATDNAKAMTDVQTGLLGQMEAQQSQDLARQQVMTAQIESFQGGQGDLVRSLEGLLQTQEAQSSATSSALTKLLESFTSLAASHERATETMLRSSGEMKSSSTQLGMLSANVKDAATALSERIGSAVELVQRSSEQSASALTVMQQMASELQQVNGRIESTAASMTAAAEQANHGLSSVNQHFTTLGESLRSHVTALEEQMAGLLEGYTKRVQEQTVARLDVWNSETSKYVGLMTDAVRTLSDVVEEIDGKTQSNRTGSY